MTSDATIAGDLAEFALAFRVGVPPEIAHDVTGRLLDVIGNCLAASSLTGLEEPHVAIVRLMEKRGGTAEASALTSDFRMPASSAAMVNGTLAHALDFDDTHLPSVLHPSASVVPAALAMAQSNGNSGAELVAAIAVGVEVCNRIGMASYVPAQRNSSFFARGLHATSICGTLGAAVAGSMLLGLDVSGVQSALGIAASMGAGIIEANRTGGTVKRIHCGWAAHAGVEAAIFAANGITGPPTVFEGVFGFFNAYLGDDYDLSLLTKELGERWELLRTVYKPYPANHFTHPAIDAALALRKEGVDVDAIESIEVGVAETVIRTIGAPREEKIRPRTPYHAKFSAPYNVATALVGGGGLGVGLNDYTEEALADRRRLSLAARVDVVPDSRADEVFPNAFAAVVRLKMDDGSERECRKMSSRGGPENPLTHEELETKFLSNAARAIPESSARALAQRIRAVPDALSVDLLLEDLRS